MGPSPFDEVEQPQSTWGFLEWARSPWVPGPMPPASVSPSGTPHHQKQQVVATTLVDHFPERPPSSPEAGLPPVPRRRLPINDTASLSLEERYPGQHLADRSAGGVPTSFVQLGGYGAHESSHKLRDGA